MSFRFFRRIKIAPGLTLNLSKGGVSMSAGPRGAKMTVGSSGVTGSVGLPGSGLFYRKKISAGKKSSGSVAENDIIEYYEQKLFNMGVGAVICGVLGLVFFMRESWFLATISISIFAICLLRLHKNKKLIELLKIEETERIREQERIEAELQAKIESYPDFVEDSKVFNFGNGTALVFGKTGMVGLFTAYADPKIVDVKKINKIARTDEERKTIISIYVKDFDNPRMDIEIDHYGSKAHKDAIKKYYSDIRHVYLTLKNGE